jgi:hypothetical protein
MILLNLVWTADRNNLCPRVLDAAVWRACQHNDGVHPSRNPGARKLAKKGGLCVPAIYLLSELVVVVPA